MTETKKRCASFFTSDTPKKMCRFISATKRTHPGNRKRTATVFGLNQKQLCPFRNRQFATPYLVSTNAPRVRMHLHRLRRKVAPLRLNVIQPNKSVQELSKFFPDIFRDPLFHGGDVQGAIF